MAWEGIHAEISARFLRVSSTLLRLAEAQCNGDWPADNGDKDRQAPCADCQAGWHRSAIRKDGRCVDCHAGDRAKALAARWLPGWTIELAGDPRGCVLKLKTPQGREIGVP